MRLPTECKAGAGVMVNMKCLKWVFLLASHFLSSAASHSSCRVYWSGQRRRRSVFCFFLFLPCVGVISTSPPGRLSPTRGKSEMNTTSHLTSQPLEEPSGIQAILLPNPDVQRLRWYIYEVLKNRRLIRRHMHTHLGLALQMLWIWGVYSHDKEYAEWLRGLLQTLSYKCKI